MEQEVPRKRKRSHRSRTSTGLTFVTKARNADRTTDKINEDSQQRTTTAVASYTSVSVQRSAHGRLLSSNSTTHRTASNIANEEVNLGTNSTSANTSAGADTQAHASVNLLSDFGTDEVRAFTKLSIYRVSSSAG